MHTLHGNLRADQLLRNMWGI